MSRSEHSIFSSNEEAALTLTLVAKGMINVDDFPEKMRSGTSKVMMEISGRFLLENENTDLQNGLEDKVIRNVFCEKVEITNESDKEAREPGA